MIKLWPVLLVFVTGCASLVKTAGSYSADGLHEFAVPYYVANYMSQPKDASAKSLLQREIDLTFRTMDLDYRNMMEKRQYKKAAGLALRKEELATSLQGLSLANITPDDAGNQFSKALGALSKKAIQKVDQAEIQQRPLKERIRLLRQARGLNSGNPELDERYRRLRSLAMRYVRVRCGTSGGQQELCQVMAAKVAAAICGVNREFVVIVDRDNDPRINTGIDITIRNVQTRDTRWIRVRKGRVKASVQRLNRFREPVLRDGSPVYYTVRASYEIYRRTISATVGVQIRIRDLGPGKKVLYSRVSNKKKTASAAFYRWSGDERAINAYPMITRLGTSEYPPMPARKLVTIAGNEAIKSLLSSVINVLEYR